MSALDSVDVFIVVAVEGGKMARRKLRSVETAVVQADQVDVEVVEGSRGRFAALHTLDTMAAADKDPTAPGGDDQAAGLFSSPARVR